MGTFALVLVGTGAIVADSLSGGGVTPVGVALCFGLVVAMVIYSVGDISGAHLNPAVTAGFWLSGRVDAPEACAYAGAQCAGALAASAFLALLFPAHVTLGATAPVVPAAGALAIEVAITSCSCS